MGFTILGTGSALPTRSVSNDELSEFLDTSDEWIFTRTGIKSRHVCTTESLDDLAVAASERALQVSGIDASPAESYRLFDDDGRSPRSCRSVRRC